MNISLGNTKQLVGIITIALLTAVATNANAQDASTNAQNIGKLTEASAQTNQRVDRLDSKVQQIDQVSIRLLKRDFDIKFRGVSDLASSILRNYEIQQRDIGSVKENLTETQSEVDALTGSVNGIEDTLTEVDTSINSLTRRVADAESGVTPGTGGTTSGVGHPVLVLGPIRVYPWKSISANEDIVYIHYFDAGLGENVNARVRFRGLAGLSDATMNPIQSVGLRLNTIFFRGVSCTGTAFTTDRLIKETDTIGLPSTGVEGTRSVAKLWRVGTRTPRNMLVAQSQHTADGGCQTVASVAQRGGLDLQRLTIPDRTRATVSFD